MSLSTPLSNLFGKSPFKPMQEHMRTVTECAAKITPLIHALCEGDDVATVSLKEEIFKLEAEADQIKHALRIRLPKSLFMPVDRRDLLELLDLQDNIADTAQDIAELMIDRGMIAPDPLKAKILELSERSVDTCRLSASVIEMLDELVELGFGGREADRVLDMVTEINEVEHKTDTICMELNRHLFAIENELPPVSVVFWHQVIQMTADLADYAEKIGNRVRLLLAR
ncbi:MAG: TIGR00153 family protein [Magnetococcales bacterium]|nr:TIGR00153 family protein [Magnetococcales bacterium]